MNSQNYIKNEKLVGDGFQTVFTLNQFLKPGTAKMTFNGILFYDWRESLTSNFQIIFDVAPQASDEVLISYYNGSQPGTLNALKYITTRQIKDSSRIADLIALSSDDMFKLIKEAEKHIDSVVGYHRKYYEWLSETPGQMRTFPRVKDDPDLFNAPSVCYPFVPQEITTATLYAVENIFLKGVQANADDGAGPVLSKKLGDFSYSKAEVTGFGAYEKLAIDIIGKKALSALKGFIKKTGTLSEEKTIDRPLNSRQEFIRNNPYLQ